MSLSEWSTDWLGYSRYDGVVVTGSDMEKMPVTVRNAIFDYVQCGGTLLVLGDWQGSAEWKGNTAKDEPFDVRSGPFDAKAKGFGLCIIDDSETSTWDNVKWSFLISSIWNKTSAPFMNNMTVKVANTDFPVVSDLKIPAKGLLLLVILFAVAMGPANIYILSKMKRRIWLLWTVPVIAIFASVSVFAYATLAEGWAGVRKSETVTILDEQQHKAYTIGVCAFYSPLTPRRGLLFDYATEVTAVAVQQSFGGGRPRTLVLTDGQNFDSGWVRARVPAHFLVRKSETRRERVKLSIDEKGHISAVNGLGGDVKTLWYMDNDGMIFKAENIPAGSRASLSASGSQVKTSKNQNPRRFFSENNWVRAFVNNDPMSFLSRNTYVAEVEDSLFLEQGLENVKKDDSRSIVIGLLKGDLDAG